MILNSKSYATYNDCDETPVPRPDGYTNTPTVFWS